MRSHRWAALAAFMLVATGCGGGGSSNSVPAPSGSPTQTPLPSPSPSGSAPAIYVANFGNNSVTVYNSNSNGNVAPVRTISGSATGLISGRAVAVDTLGRVYVANLLGPSSILVFAAGANGNAAPIQNIQGLNTNLRDIFGIAVNANFSVAVTNHPPDTTLDAVLVFAPGTTGNVAPLHTITGNNGMATAMGLAFDSTGALHTVLQQPSNYATNTTLTFAPNADATAAPVGVLAGSATQLDTSSLASSAGQPAIAVPQATPEMYVAMPPTNGVPFARVMVFPTSASGNQAPLATISGPLTTLSQPAGVAGDTTGNIYVLDAAGSIAIFGPGANGNVAPIRVISGSSTLMNNPLGIAVGP